MPDKPPISNHRFYHLAVLTWLVVVSFGFWAMAEYELSPGIASTAGRWPEGASVPRAPDRHTLIVFAHPQCPCTRATITELEKMMGQSMEKIAARVFF